MGGGGHSVKGEHQRATQVTGGWVPRQTAGAGDRVPEFWLQSSLIETYFQGLFSMKQSKKYFTEVVT